MKNLPLNGMIVLDFSQYLSGPSASLRLADFGARVIKIERPNVGDAGRKLAIKNLWIEEDSLLFHTINRNKESFVANIKDKDDIELIKKLIKKADVIIHNFRPGIMEKVGLDYYAIKKINSKIIYGCVSGYGNKGPWKDKPGQDLLIQSLSGLTYTSGNVSDAPIPFGTSIADILSGAQLVQGILAAANRRYNTGEGALIEVSLLESMIDFQFELFTTFYTNNIQPKRSSINNGHTLLGAPYGIYKTQNGYIALAMIDIVDLSNAISCNDLSSFSQSQAFSERDSIKEIIANHLIKNTSEYWLQKLQDAGLWASNVFNWEQMIKQEAYKNLNIEQTIHTNSKEIITTRCPILFNNEKLISSISAPKLGEDNNKISEELLVNRLEENEFSIESNVTNNSLLNNLLVVDFSQFLSGPSASLRLADLGAEVIKIEKPRTGDICRQLYVSDIIIEDESTIFHAINRNKKSYAADLKNEFDLEKIKRILLKADIVIHNFRPGVMKRLGLDYEIVKKINPSIIYAEISGYGNIGSWSNLPGQDLLLQSISGLTWLSNNNETSPTPMGVAVADILAGTHLTQGILAALHKKNITQQGSLVQVSMFESILDFQFETLTCFYNDGNELPVRSNNNNAHPFIGAPYGIYKTSDGFIAIAMANIIELATLLNCKPLFAFDDSNLWFEKRDEIKNILAMHLINNSNNYWLNILEKADIWCSAVFNYNDLVKEDGYQQLDMEQVVETSTGLKIKTTRCPIKVDGKILKSLKGAPMLGENNNEIDEKFDLNEELVFINKK